MTRYTAEKEAKELVAKLGRAWKANVWKNCGNYYYCAVFKKGYLSVYPGYFCLMNDSKIPSAGSSLWHDRETYKNPRTAVWMTLQRASRVVFPLAKLIKEAKDRFCKEK